MAIDASLKHLPVASKDKLGSSSQRAGAASNVSSLLRPSVVNPLGAASNTGPHLLAPSKSSSFATALAKKGIKVEDVSAKLLASSANADKLYYADLHGHRVLLVFYLSASSTKCP